VIQIKKISLLQRLILFFKKSYIGVSYSSIDYGGKDYTVKLYYKKIKDKIFIIKEEINKNEGDL